MPTCMIIDNPEMTRAHTDRVIAHVRGTGPVPAEGAHVIFGGPTPRGWRMVSVWDTPEAAERFVAERLAPAYEAAGLSLDRVERTGFEVYAMGVREGAVTALPV